MEHQELYNRPDNLFRPPDWRWRRAADLVDGGGPLLRQDHTSSENAALVPMSRWGRRATVTEKGLALLSACPAGNPFTPSRRPAGRQARHRHLHVPRGRVVRVV